MTTQTDKITLVIPGRNASATLRPCLEAVCQLMDAGDLEEIIFVDDGSTDNTRDIAGEFPVRVIAGAGRGAAAARNLGWRAANTKLVWFMDADCEADPEVLRRLRAHLDDHPEAGGVGGSFTNTRPNSLIACLIHEEIVERHRRMPNEVNFLASGNVMYRREVLEQVAGFDETCFWAHDADLAFRVRRAGHRLRFEQTALVGHAHPTKSWTYLRKQRLQGYYRVLLYLRHPGRMQGDSYSGLLDHCQPPLAMLTLATLPLAIFPLLACIPLILACLLLSLQWPMTRRIVQRMAERKYLSFAPMSFLRAFYRGIGMTQAVLGQGWLKLRSRFAGKHGSEKSANQAS